MSVADIAPLSAPLRVTAMVAWSARTEKFPEVAGTQPRAEATRPAAIIASAAAEK